MFQWRRDRAFIRQNSIINHFAHQKVEVLVVFSPVDQMNAKFSCFEWKFHQNYFLWREVIYLEENISRTLGDRTRIIFNSAEWFKSKACWFSQNVLYFSILSANPTERNGNFSNGKANLRKSSDQFFKEFIRQWNLKLKNNTKERATRKSDWIRKREATSSRSSRFVFSFDRFEKIVDSL